MSAAIVAYLDTPEGRRHYRELMAARGYLYQRAVAVIVCERAGRAMRYEDLSAITDEVMIATLGRRVGVA